MNPATSTNPSGDPPPALTAAASSDQTAAAASVDVDNAKVERLMALGFSRDHCVAVLKMAGGNEEYAAGVLFEMQ